MPLLLFTIEYVKCTPVVYPVQNEPVVVTACAVTQSVGTTLRTSSFYTQHNGGPAGGAFNQFFMVMGKQRGRKTSNYYVEMEM